MNMTNTISRELLRQGAALVGFADLTCLSKECRQNFDRGIVIAVAYTKEAMEGNINGDPRQYFREFTDINKKLPVLANNAYTLLREAGYKALAKVSSMVIQDENYNTVLPHKTVATLAGLGWIGKCATLVTREYGSAVRLTVVLTDAPLTPGDPVTASSCDEDCAACKDACPGNAVRGCNWHRGLAREAFFDAFKCKPAARARAKDTLGIDETVCGLCISSCPVTRSALNY